MLKEYSQTDLQYYFFNVSHGRQSNEIGSNGIAAIAMMIVQPALLDRELDK